MRIDHLSESLASSRRLISARTLVGVKKPGLPYLAGVSCRVFRDLSSASYVIAFPFVMLFQRVPSSTLACHSLSVNCGVARGSFFFGCFLFYRNRASLFQ